MKLFFATTAALLMGAAPVEACGIYSPCSGHRNEMDATLHHILDSLGYSEIERANDAAERRHRELMRELRRRRSY